jgi:benzoyl-CoA reductase/2-hydroxyglutaryl-CoA dehydratase subunit BcrC/BadD/HgdB
VSSRQHAPRYLQLMNARGYQSDLCAYCSLAFASTLDPDPTNAPWGGLPKISLGIPDLACDSQMKIFGLWNQEHGVLIYPFERTMLVDPKPMNWWDKNRYDWEELYQPHRLDLMVEELKGLITFLEVTTGRTLSETKLKRIMDLVNEQEEYSKLTRDLIAATVPTPVSIVDSIPSVMIPQWHRGAEWAVHAAKMFYEEVKAKVARGDATCANEKIRLMWIGRGLWFNTGFYQHFQDKYGAVFVWSFYLALAADGYARYGDDPLRTLAARYTNLTEGLNIPPSNAAWYVNEAKRNKIRAAVHLTSSGNCLDRGAYFVNKALEDAGIPVFEIGSDNVDSRTWNDEEMTKQFSEFLETRVL